MSRLQRMRESGSLEWSCCAVLARTHKYLAPIQDWCEQHDIPYYLAADKGKSAPLIRYREFVEFVDFVRTCDESVSVDSLGVYLDSLHLGTGWQQVWLDALEQLYLEFGDSKLSARVIVDWLYDYFREIRQKPNCGLFLGTVHSAKGLEFDHVVLLDGGWSGTADAGDDERRLYYVGMTRAAETLTLCEFADGNPFSTPLNDIVARSDWSGEFRPELAKRYYSLGLTDIDIGYAGRYPATASIHKSVADIRPGSPLKWVEGDGRIELIDQKGNLVGRTSAAFKLQGCVESCEVAAVIVRYDEDSEEPFRSRCKSERWEVVIPRLTVVETDSGAIIDKNFEK